MLPSVTHRGQPSEDRRTRAIASLAAGVACWLWGGVAIVAGMSLLVLFAVNRAWADGVEQSLLFRLIAQAWIVLQALGATRLPGMDIDPRRLYHYTNRDFDDAFLIGSALIAFLFAAAVWMTGYGLGRGSRWAFRSFVGLSSVAAVAIAAYAAWYISHGASADVLAVIAVAAALPAALAATSFQQAIRPSPVEHAPAGRRNPLTRPALLLLLSVHAMLVVPALACAWVLAGILVRQLWLAWAS